MSSSNCKLTIDLDAIADNWLACDGFAVQAETGAVVKADAYGLGVARVSRRLYRAGCRSFFVASLEEAKLLQQLLPSDACIYILSGISSGDEHECLALGLIPVLVSFDMLLRWVAAVKSSGLMTARSALKLDTGMGRLGLTQVDFLRVMEQPNLLECAGTELIISHLACADEPQHPLNTLQLERFNHCRDQLLALIPSLRFSLANSAGCALGEQYHFDLVRPGVVLYGSKLNECDAFPVVPVVGLALHVVQLKTVSEGGYLGYGATFQATESCLIATAAGGYADGILRSLSNKGCGYMLGDCVPIVGRISMDSTMFDVTRVKALLSRLESMPPIELLGAHQGVDELAKAAGTISYEILTSMGERFSREYLECSL